jgi:hypothetical protein
MDSTNTANNAGGQIVSEVLFAFIAIAYTAVIYFIGVENGEAKAINKPNDVDRFEVIDHRQCVYCRGRKTANYAQKDGSYKELPCDKCNGSGTKGGRVYGAFSNPETSIIGIQLSYQDNDKTLKVFIKDR